jgi:flagellar hook assembly protein FlgD
MLSRDCEITIEIYTISGKKVYSYKTNGRAGFNSIPWDGRDNQGDKLANNTYFVKVRAKDGKDKTEKIEKLVIYH